MLTLSQFLKRVINKLSKPNVPDSPNQSRLSPGDSGTNQLLSPLKPSVHLIFRRSRLEALQNTVFLEISPNSQENTCARVSATLLKKRIWHSCFPMNLTKFLITPFLTEHLWSVIQFILHVGVLSTFMNQKHCRII